MRRHPERRLGDRAAVTRDHIAVEVVAVVGGLAVGHSRAANGGRDGLDGVRPVREGACPARAGSSVIVSANVRAGQDIATSIVGDIDVGGRALTGKKARNLGNAVERVIDKGLLELLAAADLPNIATCRAAIIAPLNSLADI